MWVDTERCIPLRQEFYVKSGQLLKRSSLLDYRRVDGKWTPMRSNYKDVMKDGGGTDMVIKSIKYDQNIPASQFDRFDDELSSWLIGYACVDWNV